MFDVWFNNVLAQPVTHDKPQLNENKYKDPAHRDLHVLYENVLVLASDINDVGDGPCTKYLHKRVQQNFASHLEILT